MTSQSTKPRGMPTQCRFLFNDGSIWWIGQIDKYNDTRISKIRGHYQKEIHNSKWCFGCGLVFFKLKNFSVIFFECKFYKVTFASVKHYATCNIIFLWLKNPRESQQSCNFLIRCEVSYLSTLPSYRLVSEYKNHLSTIYHTHIQGEPVSNDYVTFTSDWI